MIGKLLKRDLLMAISSANGLILTLLVLIISTAIYSFMPDNKSHDPDFFIHNILLSLTFTSLLSANIIFFGDLEDGSIEQIIIAGASAEEVVIAKVILHFIISSLPIIIAQPFIAQIFQIELHGFSLIMLLVGMSFSFTTVYTGLVISLLNNNALIGNLVSLPLMITPLIVAKLSLAKSDHLMMLIGLSLITSAATFLMSTVSLRDLINKI